MKKILILFILLFGFGVNQSFAYDNIYYSQLTDDYVEWDNNAIPPYFHANGGTTLCSYGLSGDQITKVSIVQDSTFGFAVLCSNQDGEGGWSFFQSGNSSHSSQNAGNTNTYGYQSNKVFAKHNSSYNNTDLLTGVYTPSGGPSASMSSIGGHTPFYVNFATSPPGPPVLEITATGSTYLRNDKNGVDILFLETNSGFDLSYYIKDLDNGNVTVDSGYLGSFSGGLQAFNFINDDDFEFIQPLNYRIGLLLTDENDSLNIINLEYDFQYYIESNYEEPNENDFNFITGGFTFFENGFVLNNFIPTPFGGELYFEIKAPNPSGTGTILLETRRFLDYFQDGGGYGFDSMVNVTYPYHETPGIYGVKTFYEYDNIIVSVFGTGYIDYTITVAESPSEFDGALYACDSNDDGILSDEERSICDNGIIGNWLLGIPRFIFSIKQFFIELMKLNNNNVEVKEWGFFEIIPKANAQDEIIFTMNTDRTDLLGDLYGFLKGFIIFTILILSLILIIFINKKE